MAGDYLLLMRYIYLIIAPCAVQGGGSVLSHVCDSVHQGEAAGP